MRSAKFYARLAAGNLWRNRASYLPYLLACITSVFTQYCLWAIMYSGSLSTLPFTEYVEAFTMMGSAITAIFCAVLLFWTNAYLIKRRKKELALYSILGMEKSNIAAVLFFETLFVAGVSLIGGIGAGLLLSRLLFACLLRLIRVPVEVGMEFSLTAVGWTVGFFLLIFLLILLRNLRQVRLASPTEMLAGAKHGEKEPRANWLLAILGVVGIGTGYYLAWTTENPAQALFIFLLAALLVIVGTYCLFTAGSVAVLKMLRRNKNYYYKPNHFISVSGLIHRMKQNAAGLASICILSCMVLVTVSATVSLYAGAEDSMNDLYPYDYTLTMYDASMGEDIAPKLEQARLESGATFADYVDYQYVGGAADYEGNNFTSVANTNGTGVGLSVMTLDDYNAMTGTDEVLGEGETLFYHTSLYDAAEIKSTGTLTLNGASYPTRTVEYFGRQRLAEETAMAEVAVVVRDEAAMQAVMQSVVDTLGPAGDEYAVQVNTHPTRTIRFDVEGTAAQKDLFHERFNETVHREDYGLGMLYRETRYEGAQSWYAMFGGFLFLGIYFGVMFLLAAVLIIYYKQVSEGYEDRDRFQILQQVGMSEDEVRRTINGQVRTVFSLPLLVAVVHIIFATLLVRRVIIIFGVTNVALLALATAVTVLVYALVYLLVYRRTARTYLNIVRR